MWRTDRRTDITRRHSPRYAMPPTLHQGFCPWTSLEDFHCKFILYRFWDIKRRIVTPLKSMLRVIRDHCKWHHLIDRISVFLCNYGHIFYRFRDKVRYWSKSRFCHTPCSLHTNPMGQNACQYFRAVFLLVAWLSGRTLVFNRRTFRVLRSTCSCWVTIYVSKPSAVGQPTRPTQPFILSG